MKTLFSIIILSSVLFSEELDKDIVIKYLHTHYWFQTDTIADLNKDGIMDTLEIERDYGLFQSNIKIN